MPLHCLPIHAPTMALLEQRLRIEADDADVIEIRLDCIRDVRLAEIFFEKDPIKKPFLFVNKAPSEGGLFLGSEEERVEMLEEMIERGAQYVDVSIITDLKLIKRLVKRKGAKTKLILSYHNFKGTPTLTTLKRLVRKAKKQGADLVKIATFVKNPRENVILFELTAWAKEEKIQIITLGMGEEGRLSRIVCPLLGSKMYFAPLKKGDETAPGQLTKEELETAWSAMGV